MRISPINEMQTLYVELRTINNTINTLYRSVFPSNSINYINKYMNSTI